MLFFEFPEDARSNDDRDAVEFTVILGPYEGIVRVGRRVFQGLLHQSPTPERCMEAFHLERTRFELVVERKLRHRQLTDDGTSRSRDAIYASASPFVLGTESVMPCRASSRLTWLKIALDSIEDAPSSKC
jgi:hypothetical protein